MANNPVFLVVDYKSLYTIVTGVYHHQLPRFIGLVTIPALFISIISILNFKIYSTLKNFGFVIIFLTLVLPTIIFEIPGYLPRHSIYVLPYGLIINLLFINIIFKKIIYHKN